MLSITSQSLRSCSGLRLNFVALSVGIAGHPQESRATHSAATTAASIAAKVTVTAADDDEYGLAVDIHAVTDVSDGRVTCH